MRSSQGIIGCAIILLSACGQQPEIEPTPLPAAVVWQTPSATTVFSFPVPLVTDTPTPAPTPTPVMHSVAKGETLTSIAYKYGITVDELMAANPAVQGWLLSIGQQLVIPPSADEATAMPSPTPVPLDVSPARCFRQHSGALWCLAAVGNPGEEPAGGVTLRFSLFDGNDSRPRETQDVDLPLRRLPPGSTMPVCAFFPPDQAAGSHVKVDILSAYTVPEPEGGTAVIVLEEITHPLVDGLEVSVKFRVPADSTVPLTRLDAILGLRNAAHEIIGFRLLRMEGEWLPGNEYSIVIAAYSLGGTIDTYLLLVETAG